MTNVSPESLWDAFKNPPIIRGFCECGCGRKTLIATGNDRNNGWVKGQPKRFIIGHSSGFLRWKDRGRISANPTTGCWEITGKNLTRGYAMVGHHGNNVRAHRFFYEMATGTKIPSEMVIDHTCRNRSCVNPEHLEIVSRGENARRGIRTKLTREDVAAIRELSDSGMSQRKIAARFPVNQQQISRIVRGERWAQI